MDTIYTRYRLARDLITHRKEKELFSFPRRLPFASVTYFWVCVFVFVFVYVFVFVFVFFAVVFARLFVVFVVVQLLLLHFYWSFIRIHRWNSGFSDEGTIKNIENFLFYEITIKVNIST